MIPTPHCVRSERRAVGTDSRKSSHHEGDASRLRISRDLRMIIDKPAAPIALSIETAGLSVRSLQE